MAHEKLNQIRERIRTSKMSPVRKEEVEKLLNELETELDALPSQAKNDAKELMDLADRSTRGVIESNDPVPLQTLRDTVQDFEVNYPNLTRMVNRICAMLSNLGV